MRWLMWLSVVIGGLNGVWGNEANQNLKANSIIYLNVDSSDADTAKETVHEFTKELFKPLG